MSSPPTPTARPAGEAALPTGKLAARLQRRDAKVGVIGLGYVGLPLFHRFAEAGFEVLGFDTDPRKVSALARGESYLGDVPADRIGPLVRSGRAAATGDLGRLGEPDALIICVPTPLTPNREPDLSFVERTADAVGASLRPGQLVVLESTTYPGTTEEVVLPRLAREGRVVGREFLLAYAPERIDPGNRTFDLASIPKVVGGCTPACLAAAVELYGAVYKQVVPVSSPRVAEATKILENIYRGVNIALVNELKVVFDRMGIDVWEVIEAAKTKPFGYQAFYPGPGLGGHCIPIDPFYLTWKARELGLSTRFIELAGEVNTAMPAYVVQRLADALNERGRAVKGSRILVAGVAYKPDVDDIRESPALEILEILAQKGADVSYTDPHVPELGSTRRHRFDLKSVEPTADAIRRQDALVIVTDHASFPYDRFLEAPLVVDTRNAMARRKLVSDRVVRA